MGFLVALHSCSEAPPSIEQQIRQGDRYLEAGQLPRAVAAYRVALHQDTLNPVVLHRLSRAHVASGRLAAAEAYARRAADITYQRGLAALRVEHTGEAVAAFEQTLEIMPGHPLALNRLGDISLSRGQQERALEYYQQSARANPDFADTHLRLGALHQVRGQFEEARIAYEQAVAANINATQAYIGLGEISLHEEDWVMAAGHFRKALLIRPDSGAARSGLNAAEQHLLGVSLHREG